MPVGRMRPTRGSKTAHKHKKNEDFSLIQRHFAYFFNNMIFFTFSMGSARSCFESRAALESIWVWDPCSILILIYFTNINAEYILSGWMVWKRRQRVLLPSQSPVCCQSGRLQVMIYAFYDFLIAFVITVPPTFKFDPDYLILMLPNWERKQPCYLYINVYIYFSYLTMPFDRFCT